MAQGLRQISGSGWLTQCHQVWALQEEQAQALKPSLRECGCQLSIPLTAWGLDPDLTGASKGQR